MSQQSKNTFGLVLLVVVILVAFLFLTPAFRFSCSRVFMHDILGMDTTLFAPGTFFSDFGIARFLPLLVMFVLWGAVSVWVYQDAERRGYSGLLWGLFVFIGNIIGLIIYLIIRASSTDLTFAPFPGRSDKCPNCSRPVRKSFVACPHCGTDLISKCGQCEKKIEPDWRICPYCGQNLNQDEPSSG